MKKKSRDKTVTKIKSSSWSHNPSARKDLQIKIKSQRASSQPQSHRSRQSVDPGMVGGGGDLTKE